MTQPEPPRDGSAQPPGAGSGPGRRRGEWRHGGQPPWWPEDEQWPPAGPPWRRAPVRFRRRLLVVALFFFLFITAVSGLGAHYWHGDRQSNPATGVGGGRPGGGGPFPGVFIVIGLAALAGTGLTYRRLGGPVGDLLEAADRVGAGDYDRRLEPRGPREVQSLMRTFNEMSGRLEAADAARRQFLADVTHELRTPLAVLQSGIEAQLDGIHPRDDAHLASLLDETHVLTRVVEDLHTLALTGAGRLTLHRETLETAVVVADALAAQAATAAARGLTLTAEPATTGRVDADPVRLQQIIGNLLTNALRHTPAGGRVSLGVDHADPGWVRFTVADTGPGFPTDQLAGIFDRFTKSEASRGSGLGLAIARDLVLAHGGNIEAENLPGRGAAVSFRLPSA
ncbi:MAG: HAMP domain-containing protein [Actinobacteria bacterium]|nr:HAMP domain-containing protein [Actinomycetota bacterium]